MSRRICYFNGRFVPESEARVSIYDSALNLGDMAFEVTRTCHHRPYRLRDHLDRLFHSSGAMRIEPGLTLEEFEQVTQQTLDLNLPTEAADVDWNIIHNVSRGPLPAFRSAFSPDGLRPTIIVSCFPLTAKMAALAAAYDTGIDLVVPEQRSLPHELLDASIKNRSRLHYHLANLQAEEKRSGAAAVLVDPDGHLTEGTSGNVFLVRGGRLLTPEARNLLPGITRGVVLDLASRTGVPHGETNLTVADAAAADEMFMTSTSIGILHVRSFESKLVGDGRIGPVTAGLRAALHQDVGLDFAAEAKACAARTTDRNSTTKAGDVS